MQTLTYRVLVVLGAGEADGNEILHRLRTQQADSEPSLPTLYRTLREAVDRGWIRVEVDDDSSGRGRPPRRYRMTPGGLEALRAEAQRLRDLAGLALEVATGETEPGR